MAVDAYTIAQIDNLLKEVYDKEIVKLMRTAFPFLTRFNRWPKEAIGGKKFIVPIYLKEGDSVMAYSEGGSLAPQLGKPTFEQAVIPVRYLSGVFEVTGQAIAASTGNKFSIMDVVETAKMDLLTQLHRRQTLDFLGTNTGQRAALQTAIAENTSTTTLTVYHPLGWPVDRAGWVFKPGDHIHLDSPHAAAADTVVQSIDTTQATYDVLTVSPAIAADGDADIAADTLIYFGTASQNEKTLTPHGLLDIFALGTAYMGIDPNTYPDWSTYQYNGGTAVTLTKSVITNFLAEVRQYGGGNPNVLLCNTELIAEFIDMFGGEVVRSNATSIKGGMTKITWAVLDDQVDFFFHDFVPKGIMLALDEKQMFWATQKEGGFLSSAGGSGGFLYREQGTDVYRADWAKYYNLFTKKRNAHGALMYTL